MILSVVRNQEYGASFGTRSRDVIYDVTGMSGMCDVIRYQGDTGGDVAVVVEVVFWRWCCCCGGVVVVVKVVLLLLWRWCCGGGVVVVVVCSIYLHLPISLR